MNVCDTPVDSNKWKEMSLDAYPEVSPVKKLGEASGKGAEQPSCCKCLFRRASGGVAWPDGRSLPPSGVLGLDE